MNDIRIAAAQFENKNGDKNYNLSVIDELSRKAAEKGAQVICFHEQSVTGYTFLRDFTKEQLTGIAELIPSGESTLQLMKIAKKNNIVILAGILEKENDKLFKAMVCVDGSGVKAKFRKLHTFINPHISPGNEYVLFDLFGWTCSILICYDNNVIENVRAVTLMGAQILFAPHVTMCTPSPMPGRGFVNPALWENREKDPVALRLEFDGPKGRRWLLRWLPARAFDNGIYIVFSNPVGMDGDQLKNGNSLVLDPFGEIIAEVRSFDNDFAFGVCTEKKLTQAGGYRYRNARRPDLYSRILSQPHDSFVRPVWMDQQNEGQ
jgi:predicted amidohydrolase